MRTGRWAGVAINKTVCNRRIRQHFFATYSTALPEIASALAGKLRCVAANLTP
jgi:hypothetical protein